MLLGIYLILHAVFAGQPAKHRLTFEALDMDVESEDNSLHEPVGVSKYYIDGVEYDTELQLLVRGGEIIDGQQFGLVYDINGEPAYQHMMADFNGIIEKDGKIFLLTHWEYRVGMLYVSELEQAENGDLHMVKTDWINFMEEVHPSFNFISEPCSGTVSPWNTFLSSQEYPVDDKWYNTPDFTAKDICEYWCIGGKPNWYPPLDMSTVYRYFDKTCDWETKTKEEIVEEFSEMYPVYWSGVLIETEVHDIGDYTVTPHFSMGRVSAERAIVMPNQRTLYITEDFNTQGFYKFIADEAGDLSCGELFAAKVETVLDPSDVTQSVMDIDWVSLGHACNSDITVEMITTTTVDDYFDMALPENGECPEGFKPHMISNLKSSATECIKLKDGADEVIASRLETARYVAWMGATMEFSKMEGITFDSDMEDTVWIAISVQYRGMLDGATDDSSSWDYAGPNDIRLEENKGGCLWKMAVDPEDDFNGVRWEVEFCSEPHAFYQIDNINYIDGFGNLILAEDTKRDGFVNFAWLYEPDTKQMAPIMGSNDYAEISCGYDYKVGDYMYIILVNQHPYWKDPLQPQDCNVLGTNSEVCGEYTGTGDWIMYYKIHLKECDMKETQKGCNHSEGCKWRSKDQRCVAEQKSECSDYSHKQGCKDASCTWIGSKNKCQDSKTCADYGYKSACKDAGCKWKKNLSMCQDK